MQIKVVLDGGQDYWDLAESRLVIDISIPFARHRIIQTPPFISRYNIVQTSIPSIKYTRINEARR